jgi:UDP-N-acetylmuramoyl-tripeptide--D-alanyl-D-alanine ligase
MDRIPMDKRPLGFFATASEGVLIRASADHVVSRVCTDSRRIEVGDLFVAIEGENFDGHDYVDEALQRGAVAAMVSAEQATRFAHGALLKVTQPRQALAQVAAAYRAQFSLPVIGVAGSNGKTTTKDLIGAVLEGCFDTLRSPESYNNDIGVPMTLLSLESRHVAAVVELGTNHPGELAPLIHMSRPRLGVLTQIGEEHLEFFGSLPGVIEEEGWIADLLPPDGVLFLPGDFDWSDTIVGRARARVVRVGSRAHNDWRLTETENDAHGTTFSIQAPETRWTGEYRLNLLGTHQVSNALLAVAVAAEFGLSHEEIARGLRQCQPARWRMNRWTMDGVDVIEDCYNANLDSTLAALDSLRAFPCTGRRVVVLGPMAELGAHTARSHAAVGRRMAELGLDRLLAVGETAAASAEAASDAGMEQALAVDSIDTAAVSLRTFIRPGDCILIKGSRAARLERLGLLLRQTVALEHVA